MKKYDKPIKISSVKLTKKDIIELIKLIEKEKAIIKSYDKPNVSIHEDGYIIDELDSKNFSTHNLPDKIFNLYIHHWMGKDTKEYITILLNKDVNRIEVVGSDKVWVEGKKEELRQFLEKRKTYYSFIHQYPKIEGFFSSLPQFLIGISISFIIFKITPLIFSIPSLIFGISLTYLFKRIEKGTLLPNFVGIINPKTEGYHDKMFIVATLTLILTFVLLIIGIVELFK